MVRGYRGVICAFVGLALSGAAPPEKQAVTHQLASQPSPNASPTSVYAPYPLVEADECYQAKDHDTADLCAQWRAAFAAEKSSRVAEWGNWIGGIAAIISAASVILVVLALRQTEKTLKMAQRDRATNTRRAIASGVEAAQAIETAKRQLAATQESANRQLRPYVGLERARIREIKVGEIPIANLRLRNAGQTPATNVAVTANLAIDYFPPPPHIGGEIIAKNNSAASILPGRRFRMRLGQGGTALDQKTYDGIASGKAAIYCWGKIEYDDAFKFRHRTDFSLMMTKDQGFPDFMILRDTGNTLT